MKFEQARRDWRVIAGLIKGAEMIDGNAATAAWYRALESEMAIALRGVGLYADIAIFTSTATSAPHSRSTPSSTFAVGTTHAGSLDTSL